VGNGLYFLRARQKLFAWFVKCERQFGYETLELSVPTLPPGVLISDPRNLEFVFKNERIFSKGAFVKQRAWDLFGRTSPCDRRALEDRGLADPLSQATALSMPTATSGRSSARPA
jgi:hypothetical protein